MALTATTFKVTLQIADMDRHYYSEHRGRSLAEDLTGVIDLWIDVG